MGLLYFFTDDMNWNALEWDRAAEELTWERVRLLWSHTPIQTTAVKTYSKYVFFLPYRCLDLMVLWFSW